MTKSKTDSVELFWSNVERTGSCWLYGAGINKDGYGRVWLHDHIKAMAHQFAYELLVGPVPDGQELDHRLTCPKNCVNPEHLRLVVRKQNQENRSGANRNSTTGVRGVVWDKRRGRYRAQAMHYGRCHSGGYFDTIGEAEAAAIALRNRLFTHNDADRI